ncbi:hypothetical protein AM368_02705 [Serratia marcescens]|nr:hypothetical protein AM368_02705 [Serratia marcescens]
MIAILGDFEGQENDRMEKTAIASVRAAGRGLAQLACVRVGIGWRQGEKRFGSGQLKEVSSL